MRLKKLPIKAQNPVLTWVLFVASCLALVMVEWTLGGGTFNADRLGLHALALFLLWGLYFVGGYTDELDFTRPTHALFCFGVVALTVGLLSSFLPLILGTSEDVAYPLTEGVNKYNPYVQQFDAFMKGQTYIDYTPSADFLALENPYEPAEREGLYYLWDRAFYNGKYYAYFGIAPVLVAYFPYYLVTGKLPSDTHVMNYTALVTVALLMLAVYAICCRAKRRVTLASAVGLSLGVILPSCVLLCARGYNRFYFMASLFGMCFTAAFVLCLCLAFGCEKTPARRFWLVLAGLCYGLLFLSRVNMALVVAFIVLPILLFKFLLQRPDERFRAFGVRVVDALCLGFFVVLSVGFSLWFNYVRFGDMLEFGSTYQLTVSDVSKNTLSLDKLSYAVHYYLLAPLRETDAFPWVKFGYEKATGLDYYLYTDVNMSLGTIPFMALLGLPALLVFHPKTTALTRGVCLGGLVAIPTVLWMNYCLGGVIYRYTLDVTLFACLLVVFAVVKWHEVLVFRPSRLLLHTLVGVFAILSLSVCFRLLVSVNGNLASYDSATYLPVFRDLFYCFLNKNM